MCQAARHVSVGAHPTSFLSVPSPSGAAGMAPARCAGASHQLPILGPAIVDPRSAWAVLPPLLKGYRRLGAMVGDGAVIDEQFNTTDVCVVLPTGRMAERYRRRYRAIATLVRWRERCSRLLVAAVRTAALLGWTGLLLVPCIGCHALGRRAPALVVRAWHSGCCTIVRLRVRVCGAPSATGPTLSVANHVSYLDIVVLGSLVNAGFIAKVEVATWPLLGWIARIGRTVFIERRGLRSIGQRDEIAKRASRLTRA
jgi:hypothetical protein